MLSRETVAVYCTNHTKHINTLCGPNAQFYYAKASGTYRTAGLLKGWIQQPNFVPKRQHGLRAQAWNVNTPLHSRGWQVIGLARRMSQLVQQQNSRCSVRQNLTPRLQSGKRLSLAGLLIHWTAATVSCGFSGKASRNLTGRSFLSYLDPSTLFLRSLNSFYTFTSFPPFSIKIVKCLFLTSRWHSFEHRAAICVSAW
jgi:hypothetical protein